MQSLGLFIAAACSQVLFFTGGRLRLLPDRPMRPMVSGSTPRLEKLYFRCFVNNIYIYIMIICDIIMYIMCVCVIYIWTNGGSYIAWVHPQIIQVMDDNFSIGSHGDLGILNCKDPQKKWYIVNCEMLKYPKNHGSVWKGQPEKSQVEWTWVDKLSWDCVIHWCALSLSRPTPLSVVFVVCFRKWQTWVYMGVVIFESTNINAIKPSTM